MKASIQFLTAFTLFICMAVISNGQHAEHQQKQTEKAKSEQKDQHNHDSHHDDVNKRGDNVMGFSHAKTTHHFRLKNDGGAIEVTANDANDVASREQIRSHLKHIAKKFADGDFTAPMLIHSQTPPGVPAMKKLKAEIIYRFEELEQGGQVRISTNSPEAIAAIHEFLRFQIQDHKTGDTTEVERKPKWFLAACVAYQCRYGVRGPVTAFRSSPKTWLSRKTLTANEKLRRVAAFQKHCRVIYFRPTIPREMSSVR